jgi:penicillin-binding protein 1C
VEVEKTISRAVTRWGDDVSIAVIVLRNTDSSVAAYAGGAGFISEKRSEYVDLVQAVRSPGSTLKPFIYSLAFEKLIVHPETIVMDDAVQFRGYRPENADGKFLGEMTVRQALIRSRNTTAVTLLDKVGVDEFLSRLQGFGQPLHLPDGRRPGLALALGGVGVTLEQLTWLYTNFARGGALNRLRYVAYDPIQRQGQLISADAAKATADILGDVPAPPGFVKQRSLDGGRRIGFKTGTSFGFRDAWAVGFDQLHTVGDWIGRPDGGPHLGNYGATAAAPIMLQVFDALPVPAKDVIPADTDLGALSSSEELAERLKRLSGAADSVFTLPLEITFPRNGSSISAEWSSGVVELPLTVSGGKPPYRWVVSGVAQPPQIPKVSKGSIEGRGEHEVSVIDAAGSLAKSSFWLE